MEAISASEVYRRLDDFKADIGERLNRIEHRLDSLDFVREDRYLSDQTALDDRVEALEESRKYANRWAATLVGTSLIGPLLGLLIARGGV